MMTTTSRIAPPTAVGTAMAIARSRSLNPVGETASVVGEPGIPAREKKTTLIHWTKVLGFDNMK